MPPLEPSGALCAPGFLVSSCSSSLFEDLEYSEPSDLFQVHLALNFRGNISGALQCTARFQVRLSMDLLILKLPTHRPRLAQACGTGRPCGQCRAWCDCFYGYHIFWSWLCFVDFLLCLFISINGPSGQDLCHLLFILCGLEILNEMHGVVVVSK